MKQSVESAGAKIWRVAAPESRYCLTDAEAVDNICAALNSVIETIVSSENLFDAGLAKRAFMTFATPEYHWGLVVWLRSLRKVSDKPAFVLVSREMPTPEDITGVYLIVVPALFNRQQEEAAKFHRPELRHSMNKLWAFAAAALDRVFYVDVDCLFLKPVDELFDRPGFLVCPDYVESRAAEGFNAGVMIFDPGVDLRKRIYAAIPTAPFGDSGDQIALNHILRDEVVFIEEKYNLLRHFHDVSFASSRGDARIIHYIVKKPWDLKLRESPDSMLAHLDDLWTSFLSPDELRELVAQWRRDAFRDWERQELQRRREQQQIADQTARLVSDTNAARDHNARILGDLIGKIRRVKRTLLTGIVVVAVVEIGLLVFLLLRR